MKVRTRFAAISAVALVASGCSTARVRNSDRICSELSAFVAEGAREGTSSVTLRGGWGGDTKDAVMTHDCRASGGPAAQRFCDYLVPNTSWEIGDRNVSRMATCFAESAAAEAMRNAANATDQVAVHATLPVGPGGSTRVTVTYTPTSMLRNLYTLTVSIRGIER